jgi:hypothetical protein
MSEPSFEPLSRFTPNPGALDRDSLLYAAGRASARPNRAWIALAALQAVTQALTLALLWPSPAPTAAPLPSPGAPPPAPLSSPEPPSSQASESPGLWSVRHAVDPEAEERPADAGTLIESEPPLRAFAPPSVILN